MTETVSWSILKPFFEAMFFDLGPKEVERRTGLGIGTLYTLMNGRDGRDVKPRKRTLRDLTLAIETWQPGFYESEPTAT